MKERLSKFFILSDLFFNLEIQKFQEIYKFTNLEMYVYN